MQEAGALPEVLGGSLELCTNIMERIKGYPRDFSDNSSIVFD